MSAHDVPDLAYGDAPDSFDSPDGRTYSAPDPSVHATIDRMEQQLLDAGDEIGRLRRDIRSAVAIANQHALGDSPRADLARAILGRLGGGDL